MSNVIEISKNQGMAPDSCILHDKSTGLYLYGDLYVADEFMREKEYAIKYCALPSFSPRGVFEWERIDGAFVKYIWLYRKNVVFLQIEIV